MAPHAPYLAGCLLGAAVLGSACAAAPRPTVLYVATDGRDTWTGRRPDPNRGRTDGPLATLAAARDAIRAARARGAGTGPVTVMVRGGTYRLTEPVAFEPQDSGSAEAPVVYCAYRDEVPVFSGGRALTGWQQERVDRWYVEVPEVTNGALQFRQLFVNGRRRPRARWPLEGMLTIEGAASPTSTWAAHLDPTQDTDLARRAFQFREGDLRSEWAQLADVEVVVLQYWMEARLRIAALDVAQRSVLFTGGSWRPLTWSFGYYVDNVPGGLDQPGAWYLDRAAGRLVYHPLPGEDPATLEAVVPVAEQLVRFEGDPARGELVQYVELRGLSFEHTAWDLPPEGYAYTQAELGAPVAIRAEGAQHCRLEDCRLAHLGGWGVWFGRGCQDNALVGNEVSDVGAGCIKVGEPEAAAQDAEEACRNTIADNHLADGSAVYLGSPAVWIGQSGGNIVSHNEISGAFQWAISVGWNWDYFPLNRSRDNLIEQNHIHDLGTGVLGTHGAIYALGTSPGTVIRGNYIHDVFANEHWGAGEGIILDNGCAGILVEDNVVSRAAAGGWGCNFNCFGNLILHNIWAYGRKFQLTRYGDAPSGETRPNGEVFARNIVLWSEGPLFNEQDWWSFATLWDYNLYYDTSGRPVTFLKYSLPEWQAKGLDRHSVVADPQFVDAEHGDFTLCPGSPALALGFRPIDLSQVGPRPPEERR